MKGHDRKHEFILVDYACFKTPLYNLAKRTAIHCPPNKNLHEIRMTCTVQQISLFLLLSIKALLRLESVFTTDNYRDLFPLTLVSPR